MLRKVPPLAGKVSEAPRKVPPRFLECRSGGGRAEIGRRTGWKEKVWGRRYQAIVVSAEEEVQAARLRYVLSHGVKEGLVARVEEWPGVHCAVPLMTGAPVEGT